MWIAAKGKVEIDNGVRVITDVDICKYYQWHIHRAHYNTIKTQIPKHKGHITIVNPKIHRYADFELIKEYHGREVEFSYNPEQIYASRVNFWMPAKCSIEHEIKWILAVEGGNNYLGLHLTVANTKYEKVQKKNQEIRPKPYTC